MTSPFGKMASARRLSETATLERPNEGQKQLHHHNSLRTLPLPAANDPQQQHAQHVALIALILSKALRIQKESKSRKYRDLHGKLDDAIEALSEFKETEWPPKKEEEADPSEWMSGATEEDIDGSSSASGGMAPSTSDDSIVGQLAKLQDETVSNSDENDIVMDSTKEAFDKTALSEDAPVENLKDVLGGTVNSANGGEVKRETAGDNEIAISPINDDPQTRERMHPAVVTSLMAFSVVMSSSSKTPKMAEMSLDCVTLLITNGYVSGRAGGRSEARRREAGGVGPGYREEDSSSQVSPSLLLHLIECVTQCSESSSESVQSAMSKCLLSLMISTKCGVHEAAMLMAVRATFHVYLVSKSSALREVSKATLVDMLKAVFSRMETYDAMYSSRVVLEATTADRRRDLLAAAAEKSRRSVASEADAVTEATMGMSMSSLSTNATTISSSQSQENFSAFASQFHTDGYLLFRALCKLSARTLPGDDGSGAPAAAVGSKILQTFTTSSTVDPLALNSKILSLELILAVFENCGEAFCTGEKFIYAVQNYLCVSLLKNCMSNHTNVAHLSLKIFLLLVYKFKVHLKSEIEVFVANIFLRVLESPNSSFEQKALVLEALRALCNDPHLLTQLFLNYDCDFDAVNLYKDIVRNLTRLSGKSRQTQYAGNKKDHNEDLALGLAGLEVLVVILRAFLKALGLPGGDDIFDEDNTKPSRIRGSLHLDISLAIKQAEEGSVYNPETASHDAEDMSVMSKEGDVADDLSRTDNGPPSHIDVAGKIVDAFDRKRTAQQNFETGVIKFTLSLKGGLRFFVENDFVSLDARDVALFFIKHKDTLDKTQIGEALGKEPETSMVKEEDLDSELGGEGFFVRVLHHYVYAMDFTGLQFDMAIRTFLSGFRLPGEAQKIDRIMEKFAERFTNQNEDVFPSADTAFILAFSVIMLNTDLHNPSIKPEKRMTLDSFLRNNRGISVDGGDLPAAFLEGIYNRIKEQPFSLKEDDDAREKAGAQEVIDRSFLFDAPTFFGSSDEERKREKFRKEREEMMAASEQLFKKRPGKGGSQKGAQTTPNHLTASVPPADVVRPMFDVTWGPLIGTLSQVLEMADDETSISLCLVGFVYSIRVASHSGMSLARDTFINSLAKFTTLGSIKEMKKKNIESIRTLLSIAILDGNFLAESWGPVLQCISQLGRLQLFASGVDSDDRFLLQDNGEDDGSEGGGFFRQPTKAESARETEENNGRAILAAVNEVLIDKVFSSTVNLSAHSIVHFIEQLAAVSEAEISGNSKRGISDVSSTAKNQSESKSASRSGHGENTPRIFSLQRLVEVADYNMDVRPRIAWAQMWELMANHFAKIGCHKNAMVSMFAIDALRQLSFKFLEKPELSDFNFQRLFLQPFLLIMENPVSREDIRELILRCVDNMIRSMSHNLRSGWKVFFSILTLSSGDKNEKISTLGLAILQRLLDQHLDQLCQLTVFEEEADQDADVKLMSAAQRRQRNSNAEDFVGLCRASLSFVQTQETDNPLPIGLSMRALCHTACYADLIVDGKVLAPVSGSQSSDPLGLSYTYEGLPEGEAEDMVLWRPLLDGLADGMCSTAPSNSGGVGCLVQRGSVMTMRAILLRHGKRFSVTQWSVILRQVILPAIQIAAEYDDSPVSTITSESPALSSLDFLSDPLPLPPHPDDEGLVKFAMIAESEESAPARPLGEAELLVEASFADLRHGGDGNLSQAHGLAKKNLEGRKNVEQPFPDSWVATTAPMALGMLTDIVGEMVLSYGEEGRKVLWPIIFGQFQRWSIGYPLTKPIRQRQVDESKEADNDQEEDSWTPSEALVRIGCKELERLARTVVGSLSSLEEKDAIEWPKVLCMNLADTLSKNVTLEGLIHERLVESKLEALGLPKRKALNKGTANGEDSDHIRVSTPVGNGYLLEKRTRRHKLPGGREFYLMVDVIHLDFGGILYHPSLFDKNEELQTGGKRSPGSLLPKPQDDYVIRYIPLMKIRCVASYCIQHHLPSILRSLWKLCGKEEASAVLGALDQSRSMARRACLDEDLAHAFQEAMFSEWGDGVEEVEAALASMGAVNHKGGSEMFFLTQEAGANKAMIHFLSLLFCPHVEKEDSNICKWDTESFSEPFLFERMKDVFTKFLESERRDGILIDPNVWRMASESGGKIALYCTSFAVVVVCILNTILILSDEQFERHKKELYPILCSLICVQSDEIRGLVRDIFVRKIGPIAGVSAA